MSASLSLRRYEPEDHARVVELHEAAMRAVDAYVEGVPDPDLDDIEGTYLDGDGEFLVGERDGRLLAMGAFRPAEAPLTEVLDVSGRTAELKRMRVDPGAWRNGYGQRVYDELERRARERGYTALVLDTMPHQTGARRFYATNGFELVRRGQLRGEAGSVELLFYRKQLPGTD